MADEEKVVQVEGSVVPAQAQQAPLRGVVIEIQENGSFGMKLSQVTILEAYGALKLLMNALEKQLGAHQ